MRPTRLLPITLALVAIGGLGLAWPVAPAAAAELKSVAARPLASSMQGAHEGVVEAVRQTLVAAQVSGAVVQLDVKVGDRVAAGQVLLRLDARAADQGAAASDAQVQATRAALELARQDLERQRQLFETRYISRAALDRAEAAFRSTQAGVNAQSAQAAAARTQTSLHVVRAPFAGVVSEVPVSLGDMALPGRALLTLYDPASLRVTASVPQSIANALPTTAAMPRIELPGLPVALQWVQAVRLQVLPTVDPGTHTVQVRAELPAGLGTVTPGTYARLWLPAVPGSAATGQPAGVSVPRGAVVRRAELTGLYVLDAAGRPVLRQVRLGRADGEQVEVLAGLSVGEQVALEPQAAARVQADVR